MSYTNWFEKHSKKHSLIINKLLKKGYDQDMIIEYFDFESMIINEREFCLLYESSTKCHDLDDLNCYLCGCPNFRFDDDAKEIKSYCSISCKDGKAIKYGDFTHQDCTNCTIPHKVEYIDNLFSLSWQEIMKNVKGENFDQSSSDSDADV